MCAKIRYWGGIILFSLLRAVFAENRRCAVKLWRNKMCNIMLHILLRGAIMILLKSPRNTGDRINDKTMAQQIVAQQQYIAHGVIVDG